MNLPYRMLEFTVQTHLQSREINVEGHGNPFKTGPGSVNGLDGLLEPFQARRVLAGDSKRDITDSFAMSDERNSRNNRQRRALNASRRSESQVVLVGLQE